MDAGQFNKIISIEAQTQTSDGGGGTTITWSTWAASVWAAIWPVSAKEIIQSGVEEMVAMHKIRIRYRSGLTPKMRIKYGAREFDIVSIRNIDTGNREIEILAREDV